MSQRPNDSVSDDHYKAIRKTSIIAQLDLLEADPSTELWPGGPRSKQEIYDMNGVDRRSGKRIDKTRRETQKAKEDVEQEEEAKMGANLRAGDSGAHSHLQLEYRAQKKRPGLKDILKGIQLLSKNEDYYRKAYFQAWKPLLAESDLEEVSVETIKKSVGVLDFEQRRARLFPEISGPIKVVLEANETTDPEIGWNTKVKTWLSETSDSDKDEIIDGKGPTGRDR